jgi:phospholipid N-methyltransferase
LQDPRLQILEGCATKISRSVNGKVDGVVSALPLLNFSQQKKVKILNEVEKVLAPGGVFVQFSYGFFRPWLDLKKHFRKIKVNFVLLNFPPAFVFVCQK